jgi:hypothetical protein
MRRSWSSILIITAAACCEESYASSAGAPKFSLGRVAATKKHNKVLGLGSGSKLLDIRGGSTKAVKPAAAASAVETEAEAEEEASPSKKKNDELQAYRLQQQLYLQSRSLQLRQALIARGLTALQHGAVEETVSRHVDWDCAVATAENPKSCLYSFDAEQGSKVVAPIDTDQWITLSALNRLRRTDPTKVEPLWHSQYSILKTWLQPASQYSLYNHLTPTGQLLSFILDAPIVLATAMVLVGFLGLVVTLPFWEGLVQTILTHPLIWKQWPQWGRFVHAALPLKLLLGQLAWKAMAAIFGRVYARVRDQLIEWECQIWEECMPLTILEGNNANAVEEEEE